MKLAPATSEAPGDVHLLEGDEPECESELLGVVEANDVDRAHAIETLRTRAGALGAEALAEITSRGPHYTAAAVRCRDLRESRPYDEIETIAIPVEGEDETSVRYAAGAGV